VFRTSRKQHTSIRKLVEQDNKAHGMHLQLSRFTMIKNKNAHKDNEKSTEKFKVMRQN